MLISSVLARKGSDLVTILPSDTLQVAARVLDSKRIGALVVRDRYGRLAGIISERDIVRAMADRGPSALEQPVGEYMIKEVKTLLPTDTIKTAMSMMTLRRIRHIPVLDAEGQLSGIVSIGDVVKSRTDERATEMAVLRDVTLVHDDDLVRIEDEVN